MARKGRRRRKFRRYIRGQVAEELSLGALVASTAVATTFDNTVSETTWVSSVDAVYTLTNWTPTAGAGPILILLAHSDYTVAEIEEWLENTGAWSEGDLIPQEQSRRMIRQVGVFRNPATTGEVSRLADGRMVHTKINMRLLSGQTLQLVCYNLGAANAGSGGVVDCVGKAHLWPTG